MNDQLYETVTRQWLQTFVIQLGLCPFAPRDLEGEQIRFVISAAENEQSLLFDLARELAYLNSDPATDTTLLIHPSALGHFTDYNHFLDLADGLTADLGFEGIFQIASFHPQYQFADTHPDDTQNYSNKSPYPMLHLLREEQVERAVEGHPDIASMPLVNGQKLATLGREQLAELWQSCFEVSI